MKHTHTSAFTLTELIIVVTILAILGTIAFISFIGYSEKTRNSSRISDMKTIEKVFSIHKTHSSLYPLPDDATVITYSWSLAWTQGFFGATTLATVKRVSNIPEDPLFGVKYSYGVSQNRTKYSLGTILEGDSGYVYENPLLPTTHALSSDNKIAYVLGDYIDYDVPIIDDDDNCKLLAVPSLLLSDIPSWWIIENGSLYNYVYTRGEHLPDTYDGFLQEVPTLWAWFQTVEVLDSCTIDTVAELDLYIAELSTAYQPLSDYVKYSDLIFNANSVNFRKSSIARLGRHGITISDAVINELNSPLPERVFIDTFNDTNGTLLIWDHTPNSWSGSWSMVSWGSTAAYDINANTLTKNGSSSSFIYPSPIPTITSADYTIGFDVLNFGWWTISAYLRYTDNSNYYRLDIDSSWYVLRRMLAGVESTLQNITETINTWSTIAFSVSGSWINEAVSLTINEVEKENILAGWLGALWSPVVFLQNDGATIDSYSLTYK